MFMKIAIECQKTPDFSEKFEEKKILVFFQSSISLKLWS